MCIRDRHRTETVVLSGGVFQNRLLCELLEKRSRGASWKLYGHIVVPPNDGGVSFGQAVVAAAILAPTTGKKEKE